MKKLCSIVLMIAMVCTLAFSVNAAPGVFLSSPSNNRTPIIIDFECSDPNWKGEIYITSYGDRNVLDLIEREKFEKAYDSIRNSSSVSNLIPGISDIAANLNVPAEDLGISDLFHIGVSDITDGIFKIKLDSDTIKNFVGLVYFEDGEWKIVEDAYIDDDGYLVFSTKLPGTYAIVVDVDNSIVDIPITGDAFSWALVAIMAVSAAGIVVLVVSYRKKTVK
ncbi:MAG: hypothetical protein IJ341_01625 [Bacteroidales bacterium]|nr:hypothetical protein [Bacteroidales bacterium]